MGNSILSVRQVSFFDDRYYRVDFSDGTFRFIKSVSSKLGIVRKPQLEKWRGDLGNDAADAYMHAAQDRGSRIHKAWETLTNGGTVIFNDWRRPAYSLAEMEELKKQANGNYFVLENQDELLQAWKLKRWSEIVKPTFLHSEKMVYDLENDDAGTLDNIVMIKKGVYAVNGAKPLEFKEDGVWILDLKTGKYVDESAEMQTAAYLKCAEKMGLVKNNSTLGTIILHTGSKNKGGIEGLGTIARSRSEVEIDYEKYRKVSDLCKALGWGSAPKVFDLPAVLRLELR